MTSTLGPEERVKAAQEAQRRAQESGRKAMEQARRRFARRRRLRQISAMRWLIFVMSGLLVAAVAVWVVLFSSFLAVKSVQITGISQMTASEVTAAAKAPIGDSLARVELDAIRARVENLPTVASVKVSRCWPTKICIAITERQPAAVVERDDKLWALSADGMLYRTIDKQPAGVPVITMAPDTSSDALAQAAAIVVSLPAEVSAQVSTLDVRTVDEISLHLTSGATVAWGSAADSALKAKVLGPLIAAEPKAATYNVSVPGRPTVTK